MDFLHLHVVGYIGHQLSEKSSVGKFNCYGLSHGVLKKVATVPWF